MAEEEDEFQLVVTACLSVLILGCETKLDAALLQMTRMPWASLETVRVQNPNQLCSDSCNLESASCKSRKIL